MINSKVLIIPILLVILILIFIWIFTSIRIIKLKQRINNHTTNLTSSDTISIIDKLIIKYQNLVKTLANKLNSLSKKNKDITEYIMLSRKLIASIMFLIFLLLITIFSSFKLNILGIILSLIIGFIIPDIYDLINKEKNKRLIEKELLKAISIMNRSFSTGKSILQVIIAVTVELDGPIQQEFIKIKEDLLHGLSINVAFNRFYERVPLEEIKYINASLSILNKTGGNIVRVFSTIEDNLYTRKKLEYELNASISSSKLVFYILSILPIVIFTLISIWDSSYFTYYFKSGLGISIFIIIISLYIIYVLIINKIMKVEKY